MNASSKSAISFSDFFGQAITLYSENFTILMNFSFACAAPMILKALMDFSQDDGMATIGFIMAPLLFLLNTFFVMCLIYTTTSLATGEKLAPRDITQYVLGKFLRGAGGYLLLSLTMFLGLLLLILPGIYCFNVFSFFIFVILLDDTKIIAAFKRSDELVRHRFWTVLLAHGLVLLLMALLIIPLVVGLSMLGMGQDMTTVSVGIITALVMPILVAFYYFIYTAIKEEYDGVMNISVHT